MVNRNQDSLRTQIIDAMAAYLKGDAWQGMTADFSAEVFDKAIMPVLQAAMDAGELLLHRATTPVKPVPEAIIEWLEGCGTVLADLHRFEATVSKRELLEALYKFEQSIAQALADARRISPETTSGALGNLLAGKSLPLKG